MMKYLEAEEITEAEIKAALRKGTIAVKAIPVLCGSSYKTKEFSVFLMQLWIICFSC